ncbi:MAG: secretin N-terminal domain-containing protein, partial [Opitutaceae bacterium]|nr:secretin N-terminal domain-containing protein [Opitutaceae bacterium]
GGGSSEQGSTMTVTATATNDFWGDLTAQLQSLLTESGRVTINRLAGTVLVSDSHRNIETVAEFLASVSDRVVRQVDLEVQIYEVGFSNARQVGVNWSRVADGLRTQFGTDLIVTKSAYGPDPLPFGIQLTQDFNGEQVTATIEALEQQGDVRVVSKPRLRTLNNQPAVVRVGQDLPVFLKESLASTGDNPVITENYTVQNVTIGTMLSITPQISADGVITLDLTPAVTRFVRYESADRSIDSPNAPVIDVRQATSLVRVRDGDTIVMGGLVQEGSTSTVRKIPVIGDIPLVGKLFRGEVVQKETTELIFFLTPRIVSTEGSLAARGVATPPPAEPLPAQAEAPAGPGETQKPVRQHRK